MNLFEGYINDTINSQMKYYIPQQQCLFNSFVAPTHLPPLFMHKSMLTFNSHNYQNNIQFEQIDSSNTYFLSTNDQSFAQITEQRQFLPQKISNFSLDFTKIEYTALNGAFYNNNLLFDNNKKDFKPNNKISPCLNQQLQLSNSKIKQHLEKKITNFTNSLIDKEDESLSTENSTKNLQESINITTINAQSNIFCFFQHF